VQKNNGTLYFNEGAKGIKVENNRVVGVETDKGFHAADIIFSNAGIKRTIELVGENHFDGTFIHKTSRLKDSFGAVTIKYALDYKPVDVPITLYCDKEFAQEYC